MPINRTGLAGRHTLLHLELLLLNPDANGKFKGDASKASDRTPPPSPQNPSHNSFKYS
jgi:hypothetical protein